MTVELLTMTQSDYEALEQAADAFLKVFFGYLVVRFEAQEMQTHEPKLPTIHTFADIEAYQGKVELHRADVAACNARKDEAYLFLMGWKKAVVSRMPFSTGFKFDVPEDAVWADFSEGVTVERHGDNLTITYFTDKRYQKKETI